MISVEHGFCSMPKFSQHIVDFVHAADATHVVGVRYCSCRSFMLLKLTTKSLFHLSLKPLLKYLIFTLQFPLQSICCSSSLVEKKKLLTVGIAKRMKFF